MASVMYKVVGGSPKALEAETVGELKTKAGLSGYTVLNNSSQETLSDSDKLEDGDFLILSKETKGGKI